MLTVCCLRAQGTYSVGGAAAVCQSCGPAGGAGYTTDPDSAATSIASCVCLAGYGISDNGMCRLCPRNTYSEGGSKEECKVCAGWLAREALSEAVLTANPATRAMQSACTNSCLAQVLHLTGPSASSHLSVASLLRALLCAAVLPQPCPFGSTSPAGSMDLAQCVSVAQECPVGQMAPADAVSREQCSCYPGFGGGGSPDAPCTICPAGTYARGGDLEACTVSRVDDTVTLRDP